MELDKNIFEDKKISDLLKELYEKQHETDQIVKDNIDRLATFINSPGDAIVIVPLLRDLVDSKLKNDDTLLKVVQLFKQPQSAKGQDKPEESGLLTEKDIEQLFNEVHTNNTTVKQLTDK